MTLDSSWLNVRHYDLYSHRRSYKIYRRTDSYLSNEIPTFIQLFMNIERSLQSWSAFISSLTTLCSLPSRLLLLIPPLLFFSSSRVSSYLNHPSPPFLTLPIYSSHYPGFFFSIISDRDTHIIQINSRILSEAGLPDRCGWVGTDADLEYLSIYLSIYPNPTCFLNCLT